MGKNGKESMAAISKRWGVALMTVSKWRNLGLPIHNDKALADALLKRNSNARIKQKAFEMAAGFTSTDKGDDEGEVSLHLAKTTLTMIEEIEHDAGLFRSMQTRSERGGNEGAMVWAIGEKVKLYEKLVAIRLKLKKMGEEQGKQITKVEYERLVRAFASRASMGIQGMVEKLSLKVLNLQSVEAVLEIITPEAIRRLFLNPFARAANVAAGCGLPSWVVDCIKEECGNHIEQGEKLLEEATGNDEKEAA